MKRTNAEQIAKGLLNEERLKNENKLLNIQISKLEQISSRKDSVIFNLKATNQINKSQTKNYKEIIELKKNAKTKKNRWLYFLSGAVIGVIASLF